MLGQHQPIVAEVPLTAHQEAKPTAVTEASAGMGLLADRWCHDLDGQTQLTATKKGPEGPKHTPEEGDQRPEVKSG